uniref:Methyltransferase-like protein 17, mitochondrial n=1 Tax=Acrobeloides nanus TaxID=290746 RepID=A0A914E293_9BILA
MRTLYSPKECSFLYRVIHPFNFVRNVYETPTNSKDLLCKEETSNRENEQTSDPKGEPTYYQIKSVNTLTNSKTILRLSFKPGMNRHKNFKQTILPNEAVKGLLRALIDLKRTPKDLQNEADQLTEKLSQRRYPASFEEVHKWKKAIADKMREDNESLDPSTGILGEKMQKAWKEELNYRVAQKLKKVRYNWKPIKVRDIEDAAVLALSQLGSYFAEVKLVLEEFDRIKYKPATILDYGSGLGSVFWACYSTWGEKVDEYCMIEPNDILSQFSMDLMRGDIDDSQGLISKKAYFRRTLAPQKTYDIVFLHRTLIEIPSEQERMELLSTLWKCTNKYMVIIESDLRDSFESVMASRDYILMKGYTIDTDRVIKLFEEQNIMNETVEKVIADKEISVKEKYFQLKSMLPPDTTLPTILDPGHVFAPCPHDLGCPLLADDEKKTCTFAVKCNDIRADGKSKNEGTVKHRFSYVILEKGIRQPKRSCSRILEKSSGKIDLSFTNCTPFDGIQNFKIHKKAGSIYKTAKHLRSGEVFPLEDEFLESDSQFNFIQQMLRQPKKDS